MFDNQKFQQLVEQNQPTGEVVAVDRFLVSVKGLENVPVGALIFFENGHSGMIREITEETVLVLNLTAEDIPIGTLAVMEGAAMTIGVGEGLVGRVISALGQPVDGKGPIELKDQAPVFADAPGIVEREILNEQLDTGVTLVDVLFPIVLGQRIAVLGDGKSGKSTFLTQLTINQKGKERIVIYVMISKRKVDIDKLIGQLEDSGAINHTIVVVADVFDSLAQSYLAPYTACAIGEYLWHNGHDAIMIYDDLTSHAKVYREISLLARSSPGRDSYPGDMFYAHSSLLERAGKLRSNHKTLSAIPVIVTPNDDITAYLPTGVMSITDGQIIFDLESFRQGIRPAVNAGLSVSRVGGRALSKQMKEVSGKVFKKLADYRQAAEFSHFGSELALESQADLELGKRIYEIFKQTPDQLYSVEAQAVMLEAVLRTAGKVKINIESLKKQALELGPQAKDDAGFEMAVTKLLQDNTIQPAAPAPAPAPAAPAQAAQPQEAAK